MKGALERNFKRRQLKVYRLKGNRTKKNRDVAFNKKQGRDG